MTQFYWQVRRIMESFVFLRPLDVSIALSVLRVFLIFDTKTLIS